MVAIANWTCDAQVPNATGTHRIVCATSNTDSQRKCAECGAPRNTKSKNTAHGEKNKMSNPSTGTVKPATKPATAPTATTAKPPATPTPAAKPVAPAATAAPADADKVADKADKPERKPSDNPRLVFMSTKENGYHARVRQSLVMTYGIPKDPWGVEMVPAVAGTGVAGPKSVGGGKAEREAAKEAEKALMANMTDEQKLAHAKAKREAQQKEKETKKNAERAKLKAELLAEIEAEEAKKGGVKPANASTEGAAK